jgi:aryl-alcohol dehydrogenase-like predicted oxidoreductase
LFTAPGDEDSIKTIHRALELGVTHFDTADVYGPHKNEELLGRALQGVPREKVRFGLWPHACPCQSVVRCVNII